MKLSNEITKEMRWVKYWMELVKVIRWVKYWMELRITALILTREVITKVIRTNE